MDTNPDPATLAQAIAARSGVVNVFTEKKKDGDSVLDGYGSGFIIRSSGNKGIIMTCKHVISGTLGFEKNRDKIFVRGMGGKSGLPWQAQGGLMRTHPVADLAIIKVTGLPSNSQELKFVESDDLPVGTCVIAVGYSNPDDVFLETDDLILTNLPAVSPGAICGPTVELLDQGTEKKEIPLSCQTEKGFSGCPAICNGGVIGVVASGSEQITLAVTSETIKGIFKEWLQIGQDEDISIEDMLECFRI
ncbi:hypothetical protein ACP4OV_016701 [Aristida adscensionis]